jgi:peptidoglycan/LPS O-acetylase OafA/YrhL
LATQHAKLPIIDALRGVAIALVILVHVDDWFPSLPTPLAQLTNQGGWGVQLFFILSAVTLLMSWHGRQEEAAAERFMVRRFFRIAPMFYAAIWLYSGNEKYWNRDYAPEGFWSWEYALTAGFLHGWLPATINAVVPGGWSIAAEWTFYLMFPLLAGLLTTVNRTLAALAATVAAGGALTYTLWHASGYHLTDGGAYLVKAYLLWWFPAQLPVFLLGFLVYHLTKDGGPHGRLLAWLGLGLALALAFVPLRSLAYIPYAVAFAVMVTGLLRAPSSWVANRALVHLGKVSYSAYFLHFIVVRHTGPIAMRLEPYGLPGFLAYAGLAFALTALASTATYHLIEKPGMALGRKLAARFGQKPREEALAA